MFRKTSSVPFKAGNAIDTTIDSYVSHGGLRVVFCSIPNPLCLTSIVVPTRVSDNKGLAHTLEHLVFCGTNQHNRGFLDNLSLRSISLGTNAYTSEDHTSYTVATASVSGARQVLPVFLAHVLNPLLKDSQFLTEVVHITGDGKYGGVVYNEMAARNFSEADLLDHTLRKNLFPRDSTYAFECGGLTKDIKQLTNDEIKEYHRKYYTLENMTVVIVGNMTETDKLDVLRELTVFLDTHTNDKTTRSTNPEPPIQDPPAETPSLSFTHDSFIFPNTDLSLGCIGIGFPGPHIHDLRTILALDVLYRFLSDTSASPLYQGFVERMFASEVDYEIKVAAPNVATWIVFSGVPLDDVDGDGSTNEEEEENSEEEESEGGMEDDADDGSDDDHSIEEDEPMNKVTDDDQQPRDLFAETTFLDHLLSVLQTIDFTSPQTLSQLHQSLHRHRVKILESLEDEPHDLITGYLLPDIVTNRPIIGSRCKVFDLLDELFKENGQWWNELMKKWLMSNGVLVKGRPSKELSEWVAKREKEEMEENTKRLGKEGLDKCKELLDAAVKENVPNLTPEQWAILPNVPLYSKAGLPSDVFTGKVKTDKLPFTQWVSISTSTNFIHTKFLLPTHNIPTHLRPFLVVFQELLFQSPIAKPNQSVLDWQDVTLRTSELCVSSEASVGMGNDIFSTSWLSDLFVIDFVCEPHKFTTALQWVIDVILFTEFDTKRIKTIANQLKTQIVEMKREGGDMVHHIAQRLVTVPEPLNDSFIGLFRQENVLKWILNNLKETAEMLNSIRVWLFNGVKGGWIQVASADTKNQAGKVLENIESAWNDALTNLVLPKVPQKRKRGVASSPQNVFPYPRTPFTTSMVNTEFGKAVHVPISGVTSGFMAQFVACDVLGTNRHSDFWPVLILADLLSRSEGPLYTLIRGNGYAYDAGIHVYLWTGQLSFEIYDSNSPDKAFESFYALLQELQTDEGWDKWISNRDIETTRAGVIYRQVAGRSTSNGIISERVRSLCRGFGEEFEVEMGNVDVDDLKRIFKKYFVRFLRDDKVTVLVDGETHNNGLEKTRLFDGGLELTRFKLEELTAGQLDTCD